MMLTVHHGRCCKMIMEGSINLTSHSKGLLTLLTIMVILAIYIGQGRSVCEKWPEKGTKLLHLFLTM